MSLKEQVSIECVTTAMSGPSMTPTLTRWGRIVVKKWSYGVEVDKNVKEAGCKLIMREMSEMASDIRRRTMDSDKGNSILMNSSVCFLVFIQRLHFKCCVENFLICRRRRTANLLFNIRKLKTGIKLLTL